jgi:hypothetical protein
MDTILIIEIVSSVLIVIGVGVGLLELHQYHLARKREAASMLLNAYQSTEFFSGLTRIFNLEEGLDKAAIDEAFDQKLELLYLVMSTWESIGILLYNGEITIDMIDKSHSGPILNTWLKLEGYIRETREEMDRQTMFEWFEWLVDRMREREEKKGRVPAYIAYKDWK